MEGLATTAASLQEAREATRVFIEGMSQRSEETKSNPKLRNPLQEANNYSDNEWTSDDYKRITSVALDLAALIDPEPISAGVMGYASDVSNLWADLNEGYGIWSSLGSFAVNAGLSTLAMVPVVGDALGSGTKIVKTLTKFTPKIIKALKPIMVAGGIAAAPDILKSFEKIGKKGKENELNAQDYRNLLTGLQLLLGTSNAVKSNKAAKKVRTTGSTGTALVKAKNVKTGKQEIIEIKDTNIANEIKAAKSAKEVNTALAKAEGVDIEKGTFKVDTKSKRRWLIQKVEVEPKMKEVVQGGYRQPKAEAGLEDASRFSRARAMAKNPKLAVHETWEPTITLGSDPSNLPVIRQSSPISGSSVTPPRVVIDVPANEVIDLSAPASLPMASKQLPQPGAIPMPAAFGSELKSASYKGPGTKGRFTSLDDKTRGMIEQTIERIPFDKSQPVWERNQQLLDELNSTFKDQGYYFGNAILKGQQGMKLDDTYAKMEKMLQGIMQEIRNKQNFPQQNTGITKQYGTNYTRLDRGYHDNEYNQTTPVNISAIRNSDARLRSETLSPKHGAEEYDYTDAQKNTDAAREKWQANRNNRNLDFTTYSREWFNNPANKGKTAEDLARDYNLAIDSMYEYKAKMGLPENTGANSYRKGQDVSKFNKTNRSIYRTANTPGNVHGYDVPSDYVNGTTTSQRFLDRTKYDLPLLPVYKEGDSEDFKKLTSGFQKDIAGRIYRIKEPDIKPYIKMDDVLPPVEESKVEATPEPEKAPSQVSPAESPEVNPPNDTTSKSGLSLGFLSDFIPQGVELAKYLAALRTNKESLDNVKKMPILLHNPIERTRWLHGDLNAIQNANNQAGQLNHMASRPLTSDGSLQTSAMLQANKQGNQYKLQGALQDTQAINDSKEKVWTQEGINQQSRYTVAASNKESLHQHEVDQINAKGQYLAANYASLNNFLSNSGQIAASMIANRKQTQEAYDQASIKNDMLTNLAKYGIEATPEEQNLIISLRTGAKGSSDLTPEELQSYNRISNAMNEKLMEISAKYHGYSYTPFKYKNNSDSNFYPNIVTPGTKK